MNAFDSSIICFFNSFSRKSWMFDYSVLFVANNTFIRAGLITFILIWLWFQEDRNLNKTRESIISTVFFTLMALVFVKVFRFFLPFRPRPLHNSDLTLYLPYEVDSSTLYEWSAFPSDTATFFFAVSVGLFFISKLLGVICIAHSLVLVCMSRIYLGYHYPTDILGGMILGVIFGYISAIPKVRRAIAYFPILLMRHHRSAFYVCFFATFVEFTNVFEDVRKIILFINKLV